MSDYSQLYDEYTSMCDEDDGYVDIDLREISLAPEADPGDLRVEDSQESENGMSDTRGISGANHREPVKGFEINPVDLNQFLREDLPPRDLMLSPWFPEKGLAMIFAARGIGKTYFALEIAVAVASGTEYLGWKAKRPYRVLYLDGEMCASDLQGRLRKICRDDDLIADGNFQLINPELQTGACPDLSDPLWQRALEPVLAGVDLIVVDNISTLCRTGVENDAESWSLVQAWGIKQRSAGRSVLFIHHAGKSGDQRGTSKREDIMDTVISLTRPSDYSEEQGARFAITFTKARGFTGASSKPFEAHLESDDLVHQWRSDALPETTSEAVVRLKADGFSQKEIAEKLDVNKSTVSRYYRSS